tara:strand:+ start:107 stop:307 length:201 start_codon:yes stop_codon:yes gene_type:complete
MTQLKQTLESRIISTLKMNPDMTWTEASDLTLRSIGVHATLPSRTATIGQQRSAMAKQRIEPMAEE